jgi:predicted DsbA family dithiol-disulfide isomerase
VHPQIATLPALAACAAHKQGKYEKMEEGLWEKGYRNNRNYSQENIDSIAKDTGLNMAKFKEDMNGDCQKVIQQDQAQLSQVGVRGTPAFYINGRYLSGAQPIENFKRLIDEELGKANEAIKKGMKADDYYAEVVMKNGKKGL